MRISSCSENSFWPQPLMILSKKKIGLNDWDDSEKERDDRYTSSVRQRGRTGSCHLPLIAYVLGSPLRVHPPHSISHHQLSADVKTPGQVTMHLTEPRRDCRRERDSDSRETLTLHLTWKVQIQTFSPFIWPVGGLWFQPMPQLSWGK